MVPLAARCTVIRQCSQNLFREMSSKQSSSHHAPSTETSMTASEPSSSGRTLDYGRIGLPRRKRRFRPLGSDEKSEGRQHWPELKGIIFDVDGTLCEPQTYMFGEMRAALGIPKSVDILTHISSLPTQSEQSDAYRAIEAIESHAMLSQTPSPGLIELFTYLRNREVTRKAILTRNFMGPVEHLLGKFLGEFEAEINPVLTRSFLPPKPNPEGIWEIARLWGLDVEATGEGSTRKCAEGLIMVGDSIDDMTAGRHAGAATVLLITDVNHDLREHEYTDLWIDKLDDLIAILDTGFVGRGEDKKGNVTLGDGPHILG